MEQSDPFEPPLPRGRDPAVVRRVRERLAPRSPRSCARPRAPPL